MSALPVQLSVYPSALIACRGVRIRANEGRGRQNQALYLAGVDGLAMRIRSCLPRPAEEWLLYHDGCQKAALFATNQIPFRPAVNGWHEAVTAGRQPCIWEQLGARKKGDFIVGTDWA